MSDQRNGAAEGGREAQRWLRDVIERHLDGGVVGGGVDARALGVNDATACTTAAGDEMDRIGRGAETRIPSGDDNQQ